MSTASAVFVGGIVHYGGWMEVTALGKKLFLSLLVVDLNRKCPVQFAFSLAVKTVSSVGNSIPMMCWAALTTQGWGWGG